MKPATRLLVSVLLRLVLLGFAFWFAISPDTVPGAPALARIAIASLFLVLSFLWGEIESVRLNLGILAGALRGGLVPRAGPRDDRAAVDILVRALNSSSETTRESAHRELRRLTGQDLPAEPEAWARWWEANREGFRGPDAGA